MWASCRPRLVASPGQKFSEPCRYMREKVRFVAMWAAQPCDLARQVREAHWVEVKSSLDLVSGSRTNEIQHCHHLPTLTPPDASPQSGIGS
jgi:hypothetical protein